jgi:hypothetical protein
LPPTPGGESGTPEQISAGAENREQREQHTSGKIDRRRPPPRHQRQYREDHQPERRQRFDRLAFLRHCHTCLLHESGCRKRGHEGRSNASGARHADRTGEDRASLIRLQAAGVIGA